MSKSARKPVLGIVAVGVTALLAFGCMNPGPAVPTPNQAQQQLSAGAKQALQQAKVFVDQAKQTAGQGDVNQTAHLLRQAKDALTTGQAGRVVQAAQNGLGELSVQIDQAIATIGTVPENAREVANILTDQISDAIDYLVGA